MPPDDAQRVRQRVKRQLYTADRLIDGLGGPVIREAALLVEGDRILAAGARAGIGEPEGAEVIALPPGATLMPGLIDAHVHIAYSGTSDVKVLRAERGALSYPAMALAAAGYAAATLAHGFTAVRDMHAPSSIAIDLRNAIDAGHVPGPRIKAPGRGLTVTGGHMDPRVFADHVEVRDATHPCDGPAEFRRGVRIEARRGADFIKLNTAVGSRKVPGVHWRPEMAPDEIRAACDEAHAQGFRVAAHTSGGPPLHATVENGVDCVEHAHWIDDATIELMAERGTWLVPTLLVNERNFEVPLEAQGHVRHSDWALSSREAKWVSLEKARRAGIRVGCGTDAGFMIPHGTMNWRELQLLVDGGYTPMEAIHAATAVNAELMELDAGVLAKDRLADFLVVDGDPLESLAVLGDARRLTVFKGGARVAAGGVLTHSYPSG